MRNSEQMPDLMNYGRRGRRSGNPDTRAEILAVARRRLVADGYYGVTCGPSQPRRASTRR